MRHALGSRFTESDTVRFPRHASPQIHTVCKGSLTLPRCWQDRPQAPFSRRERGFLGSVSAFDRPGRREHGRHLLDRIHRWPLRIDDPDRRRRRRIHPRRPDILAAVHRQCRGCGNRVDTRFGSSARVVPLPSRDQLSRVPEHRRTPNPLDRHASARGESGRVERLQAVGRRRTAFGAFAFRDQRLPSLPPDGRTLRRPRRRTKYLRLPHPCGRR